MTMSPGLRKATLTVHLTASVGWIGAVVAYLALVISAVTSRDLQTVRTAYLAMDVIDWSVIVPLALAALLTKLVMSLGTPWGLFRHYWVVISLVLTICATVILLLHMPTVSATADVARGATGAAELGGFGGDRPQRGGGLLVLLLITMLNVYKPRGVTPYGWRKQQEQRALVRSTGRETAREGQSSL